MVLKVIINRVYDHNDGTNSVQFVLHAQDRFIKTVGSASLYMTTEGTTWLTDNIKGKIRKNNFGALICISLWDERDIILFKLFFQ